MANDFDSIVDAATKIMGDKMKMPKPGPAVLKSQKEMEDAYKKFDKARKGLEDNILDMQKAVSGRGLALKQYAEQIEKSDFGCDRKEADYKKKRAEAQKLFDAFFDEQLKNSDANVKNADELDKHLMDIASYQSPKPVDI